MAKGKQAAPEANQEAQTVVVSLNDEIVSLKDAGQKQARSHSLLEKITRHVMGLAPTLGDNSIDNKVNNQIPDKAMQIELKDGYMIHYGEFLKPARYFVVTANDKQYVEQPSFAVMMEHEKLEKRQLTVAGVMGLTQAELNRIKDEEPAWCSLVQELKTDFNQYASNRFGDLIKKAKEIRKPKNKESSRAPNKIFSVWEKEHLDAITTKIIAVRSKPVVDDTLDFDLVQRRIKAYWEAQ
jgi:hypothetical protein